MRKDAGRNWRTREAEVIRHFWVCLALEAVAAMSHLPHNQSIGAIWTYAVINRTVVCETDDGRFQFAMPGSN